MTEKTLMICDTCVFATKREFANGYVLCKCSRSEKFDKITPVNNVCIRHVYENPA